MTAGATTAPYGAKADQQARGNEQSQGSGGQLGYFQALTQQATAHYQAHQEGPSPWLWVGGSRQNFSGDAADAGNSAKAPPQQPTGQANENTADSSKLIGVQMSKHQTTFQKIGYKRWRKLS